METLSNASDGTPLLTPSTETTFSFGNGDVERSKASTPRTLAGHLPIGAVNSNMTHGVRGSVGLDLAAGLEGVHISSAGDSLDMSELESAINGISTRSTSRSGSSRLATPPSTDRLSPPQTSSERRRSNQRVRLPAHVVSDEESPRDRFHDPAFQQVFTDTKDHVAKLEDVLGSGSLHLEPDSTIHRIYQNAGSLAEFECPTKRVVGFVGDSGVGKSSLLNSLLDFRSLARASNSGSACTSVATEYHYHDHSYFVIEAELFSHNMLDDMLQEMLRSFRHYELYGDEMVGDEKKDCCDRANVAESTFLAMFGERLENSSRFLTTDTEDAVLRTLRLWARDSGVEAYGDRIVLETLDECSRHLAKLTSDPISPHEQAIWPYIRKLRVYTNAHVLSKGLIFADLPGLRDLNSARRNITERYILSCDEVFAVTEIFRAVTNEGVKDVVDLAKRAKLSNITIICTKSDDINPEEAIADWKGDKAKHIQRLWDEAEVIEDKLREAKEELEDMVDYYEDFNAEESILYCRLLKSQTLLSKELEAKSFELKHYMVINRNAKVKKSLLDRYQSELEPGNRLKVFCTSKDDYWSKRDSPSDEAQPLLKLSGIMALRKYCISIVSESQYQSAVKYMRHDVPALMSDIELWIQLGAPSLDAEKKKELRDAVDEVERRVRRELIGRTSQLRHFAVNFVSLFEELILGDETPFGDWNQAAREAANDWAGWHHQSYAAFCRKYGDHCTSAVGRRNWNEELLEAMVSDLDQPWSRLVNRIRCKQRDMTNSVSQMIDGVAEYLESDVQGLPDVADILIDALTSRHNLINEELRSAADTLSSELSILRTDTFSGIRTSFLGQAMEPAYRGCMSESGTGSDNRRKSIMRRHISRNSFFEDILQQTRNRFQELTRECETKVCLALADQFHDLRETLDIIRTDNAAADGEQDPEFRDRVQVTVQRSKELLESVRQLIEAAMSTEYLHTPDSDLIDQPHKVRELVDCIAGLRRNPPSLYIDLEGERLCRYGTICIMQVFDATTRQTWLIDVYALRHAAFVTRGTSSGLTFKDILEDPWTPKVFFDVRNDSDALYAEYGIDLQGIEDLQLMEFAARPFGEPRKLLMGLAGCIERDLPLSDAAMIQFLRVKEQGRKLFAPELNGSYAVFKQRPLPEAIQEYCLFDVKFMSVLWHHYNHQMCPQARERMLEESAARVAESQSPNYNPEGPGKALAPTGWSGSPWLDEALRKYKEKTQLDFWTTIHSGSSRRQQWEADPRWGLEADRRRKWDVNRDLQSELAYLRDLRARAQRPRQPW